MKLAVPFVAFDDASLRWEAGQDRDTAWLDVVIHAGEARTIALAKLRQAVLGVAVSLATEAQGAMKVSAESSNGRVQLRWNELAVSVPSQPNRASERRKQARLPD